MLKRKTKGGQKAIRLWEYKGDDEKEKFVASYKSRRSVCAAIARQPEHQKFRMVDITVHPVYPFQAVAIMKPSIAKRAMQCHYKVAA